MDKLKFYVASIGSIATALLGVWGPDTTLGHTLVVIAAVATALSVYAFPNTPTPAPRAGVNERTGPAPY